MYIIFKLKGCHTSSKKGLGDDSWEEESEKAHICMTSFLMILIIHNLKLHTKPGLRFTSYLCLVLELFQLKTLLDEKTMIAK